MASLVVSNIPLCVSDVTILKFLNDKSHAAHIEHIQPFPDAYHCINDKASTRCLQLFLKNSDQVNYVKDLFEMDKTLDALIEIQNDLIRSHKMDNNAMPPSSFSGRRLSVTTS
ncbi:hypothetical protein HG535_0C03140 [Zygotorulaspora mrakii]|uniref:Uncharacterized protein n=1 Tax=Zygotorulaspora mrakii TaxID=42260 RepID=A0A7H9B2H0_ZYGMR|nr:uncharacterized protein HG535_0C03140 [Zygotorulaspora mrakii]QLG71962.1 hypothetical protein HG535_0C03140 [Zygotorulaspora mrakii]